MQCKPAIRRSLRLFSLATFFAATALAGAGGVLAQGAAAPAPAASPAPAAAPAVDEGTPIPARQDWSFAGAFGTYDPAQLQRGFKVYREVCSVCHALSIPFRDLDQPGGPEFPVSQIGALAATYQVQDGPDDHGQMFQRQARLSDLIPPPYPNPQAAIAALGAAPPDMATLAKARGVSSGFPRFIFDALPVPGGMYQEAGPDYIYAILNGYTNAADPNWNQYFPGHHIAMPKPLTDGKVDYTDGSPQTVDQYARDISAFLAWSSEPTLNARKDVGFRVIAFLIAFGVLVYFTKKKIWAKVHDEAHAEA